MISEVSDNKQRDTNVQTIENDKNNKPVDDTAGFEKNALIIINIFALVLYTALMLIVNLAIWLSIS